MLFNLGQTKNQIQEYFQQLKDQNRVEEVFPFTPQLNPKSLQLANAHSHADIYERSLAWKQSHEQKVEKQRQVREIRQEQRLLEQMVPFVKEEDPYYAQTHSKVKQFIEDKEYSKSNQYQPNRGIVKSPA